MGLLAVILCAGAALADGSYTNLAGQAIAGAPVSVSDMTVTFTNGAERSVYRLSIFPEPERRRLAAAAGSTRFVPKRVMLAVGGVEKAMRRSRERAERGESTAEQAREYCRRERERMRKYLDREVSEGRLMSVERDLLMAGR